MSSKKVSFTPDYNNILSAANNIQPARIPLYEHIISDKVMGKILGIEFSGLLDGFFDDKKEYFRHYTDFFYKMGYDTVSFEQCITKILPGGGALYNHAVPEIENREDFNKYPWDEIEEIFFDAFEDDYKALSQMMPDGMKAIGGPGNGLFEIAQDLCGYEGLCYLSIDDPELYAEVFVKVAEVMKRIWKRFLSRFSDLYCVCRFDDDLGFNTQTLLPQIDIQVHLIPRYKEIAGVIHSFDKPFLMHSCGCIFSIMDDLIDFVGINAKHSNEDCIAPFSIWLEQYGNIIGNFGGIDTDFLCKNNLKEIEEYGTNVYKYSQGYGGIAIGSGNSIPEYVSVKGYIKMIETVRKLRD